MAVFGTGAVGLSAIMAAAVAGWTTIIGVDINASRLELARELRATHTIDSSDADTADAIREITGGGANHAVETTARPEILRQAVDSLATLGHCALVGASPTKTEASLDMNDLLRGRKALWGVAEGNCVPQVFIPRLIDLYLQGRFPFDRMIKKYALSEINRAVSETRQGAVVKPVLCMS